MRVRIGIHTGQPAIEDDDYVGIDVHHVARLCAAGHGGQVLLSKATVDVLEDVPVKDLGEHELKGLQAPERIFQLVRDGATSDFPALRLGEAAASDAQAEPVGDGRRRRAKSCASRSPTTRSCSAREWRAS